MERRLEENVEQAKILVEDQDTQLLGTNILSFCDWNVFFLRIKKRFMKISFIFTLNFMFRNVLLSSCLFLILSQRNQRFVWFKKVFFIFFLLDKIKKTVSTIEKLRKAEADFRYFNMLKKDNVFLLHWDNFFFRKECRAELGQLQARNDRMKEQLTLMAPKVFNIYIFLFIYTF